MGLVDFIKQDFGIHSLFLIAIFIFFMVYELESHFKYFTRYTYYFICVQIKMVKYKKSGGIAYN